ncbi:MAG: hypothetical protein AAGI48_17720 [Verrucomicrobiota bacterium]
MSDSGKKEDNPIVTLWRWISVPLGIIGLAGISDGIVAWKGFINELVVSYQSVVHPVFGFFFGWLPFTVPNLLYDYLFLGVIVISTTVKVMMSFGRYDPSNVLGGQNLKKLQNLYPIVIALLLLLLVWPAWLGLIARSTEWTQLFSGNPNPKKDHTKRNIEYFWKWLGAILLGFVLLLIVNYALLTL